MVKRANNTFELYLCEKPSQGRDIARILGDNQRNDGYLQGDKVVVSWCIGHLLEMIPPDEYDPKYKRWSLHNLPVLLQDWKMLNKACELLTRVSLSLATETTYHNTFLSPGMLKATACVLSKNVCNSSVFFNALRFMMAFIATS